MILQLEKPISLKETKCIWVAIQEGIPFIPCRVIPHWLPPNGSYKKLEIDFSTLKFGETILAEQLGLTVAQIGFNT